MTSEDKRASSSASLPASELNALGAALVAAYSSAADLVLQVTWDKDPSALYELVGIEPTGERRSLPLPTGITSLVSAVRAAQVAAGGGAWTNATFHISGGTHIDADFGYE